MIESTVRPAGSRRRVVRRRSAIDRAWDVALSELPAGLHQLVRQYATAKRAEYDARMALGSAMIGTDVRWRRVDDIVHKLVFS
jgi:hypothetical protein